jgi:hypothetical protein
MSDAGFWKVELFREVKRLRNLLGELGPERVVAKRAPVERFVSITAYEMRKLAEAVALSEEVTKRRHPVIEYPCTVPPPHRTWFRIPEDGATWRQPLEQHYNLDAPKRSELPFEQLCNLLIHHFAYELRLRPATGDVEILFNSDLTSTRLYGMTLDAYIAVVEDVHYDEIRWVDMDQAAGRVIQRRHRPLLDDL